MTWDRGACVLPTTHQFMDAVQYYQLPEGPPYFQLVEGEVFMSPSPNFYHQELIGELHVSVKLYLRQHPLGKVVMAPSDVELNKGNVYQPDLFFVRKDRLHLIDKHGLKGAPDLVVEIISGSTARLDLGPKKANYVSAGVLEFWAVYPRDQKLEVFRFAESSTTPTEVLDTTATLCTPLFPGWQLPLSELFAP